MKQKPLKSLLTSALALVIMLSAATVAQATVGMVSQQETEREVPVTTEDINVDGTLAPDAEISFDDNTMVILSSAPISPPTNVRATPGNGRATLTWGPPSTIGGVTIGEYHVSRNNGVTWTRAGGASIRSHTFTNLPNGQAVTLRVRAATVSGAAGQSASATVTPTASLTLSRSAWNPALGGENATVSVISDGTWNPTSNASWLTVSNIQPTNQTGNGSFRLAASANNGTSFRSGTITVRVNGGPTRTINVTQAAASTPGAPTNVSASGGAGNATIRWSPPTNNGGAAIMHYLVSHNGTRWDPVQPSARSHTFTGLPNGTPVTLRVRAVNRIGGGSIATASPVTPRTFPNAPANVSASAGSTNATIRWQPPTSNGGSAITMYQVRRGNLAWIDVAASARSYTFPNLTNGTAVTLSVRAVNAVGAGTVATAGAVTPATTPGVPTNVSASGGAGNATIRWSPPTNNGGAAIMHYQVSRDGTRWDLVQPGTLSHTFTGLPNGTPVTLRVRAVNRIGNSLIVTASPVTPRTIPNAPTNVSASAGNGTATIVWQPPTNDGGSAITGYQVSRDNVNWMGAGGASARSYTFPNLTNGTAVTLRVRAVNAVGVGTVATAAPVTPTATLNLSRDSWDASPTGSSTSVFVVSNGRWHWSSNASWLTISSIQPTNQTGNGSFVIIAAAHTGLSGRQGTITVTSPGAPTRTVTVTQPGQPGTRITLSLNANGGTVSPTTAQVEPGVPIGNVLPTPTRTGHTPAGWYRTQTGSATAVNAGAVFHNPTTLFARWNVTITFNSNGGGVLLETSRSGVSGMPIVGGLHTPSRHGHTFGGWFTAPQGGTRFTSTEFPNSHITLYARWTQSSFIWGDDTDNIVAFWPGHIRVGDAQEMGGVPDGFNLDSHLDTAAGKWSDAIGVDIGRGWSRWQETNIEVFVGPLERMQIASGNDSVFYGIVLYTTYQVESIITNQGPRQVHHINDSARIFIATERVDLDDNRRDWSHDEVLGLTMHELGHALGFSGHSLRSSDIMWPSVETPPVTSISSREREHLRQIYEHFR